MLSWHSASRRSVGHPSSEPLLFFHMHRKEMPVACFISFHTSSQDSASASTSVSSSPGKLVYNALPPNPAAYLHGILQCNAVNKRQLQIGHSRAGKRKQ